jgi:protein SCO1
MKALLLAVLLAVPAYAGIAFAHHEAKHQRVDRALEGWPIEPFTLVDQHGAKFGAEKLLGRWTFVLLGDTRCAQPCAAGLGALEGLSQRIWQSDAILSTQVLFVSLDPQRDTPAAIKAYLAPYDKRWIGATGAPQTLARLADDLSLAGSSPGGSLALVGPQGFLHAVYAAPYDVPRLTADFLKARALYK